MKNPDIIVSAHPLELIPGLRRWPASRWRNALYTAIFSTVIATVLTAARTAFSDDGPPVVRYFLHMLLVANLCGLFIHGGMVLLNRWFDNLPRRLRGLPRVALHVVFSVASVLAAIALANVLFSGGPALHLLARPVVLLECTLIAAVIAGFMVMVRRNAERRIQAALDEARQKEAAAATARLLAEARLRALQAQIEPHFLYNTLANVVSLIGTRPDQARYMLERFIDYLRASLDTSRSDASTLGDEARLLAAYLDVLAVRMGPRLRYRIDVPAELRAIAIAPMLLQPVVENAIAHGLEPQVDGGEVTIGAAVADGRLCITIADTGAGLSGTQSTKPGGGVGLGNLRERLRTLYSAEARVELLENQPSGVVVRVVLPLPSR